MQYKQRNMEVQGVMKRNVIIGIASLSLICIVCFSLFVVYPYLNNNNKSNKDAINENIMQTDFFAEGSGIDNIFKYRELEDAVSERTALDKHDADNIPVFLNENPVGQGGPEYELTDEIKNQIVNNFKTFTRCLGKTEEISVRDLISGYALQASFEGNDITLGLTGLSVSLKDLYLDENSDIGTINALINENKYVSAACSIVGIKRPYIERIITYNNYNKVSEIKFTITENSNDPVTFYTNSNFKAVQIVASPYTDNVYVSATFKDLFEFSDFDARFISYKDALQRTVDDNSKLSESDIYACAIEYNSNLVSDYLIPCYKFYIKGDVAEAMTETTTNQMSIPETATMSPKAEGGDSGASEKSTDAQEFYCEDIGTIYDDVKEGYIYYVAAYDLTAFV